MASSRAEHVAASVAPLPLPARIPRIVHQLWKTEQIPAKWRGASAAVRKYHPGWEYRLWTDAAIDAHVRRHHPGFYSVFAGFPLHIMRVDVFRYVLMHDFGGLYCDLDYQFIRPYDYGDAEVVLSLERDRSFGDEDDLTANYVFASVPGHALWRDVLAELASNPPIVRGYYDVTLTTGPVFLSAVLYRNLRRYSGVRLTPKPVLSPRRLHGRREIKYYLNSGVTYGFHHGWGTWRDRASLHYLRRKVAKIIGRLGGH